MTKFSAEERAAIIAESREVLQRLDDDSDQFAGESFEPETREQILQEALARPVEDRLTAYRRKAAERDAQRIERDTFQAEIITRLETRLETKFTALAAEQRDVAMSVASEIVELFDEEIVTPLERELVTLRGRLEMLEGKAKKVDPAEILDLPNPLDARRMQ